MLSLFYNRDGDCCELCDVKGKKTATFVKKVWGIFNVKIDICSSCCSNLMKGFKKVKDRRKEKVVTLAELFEAGDMAQHLKGLNIDKNIIDVACHEANCSVDVSSYSPIELEDKDDLFIVNKLIFLDNKDILQDFFKEQKVEIGDTEFYSCQYILENSDSVVYYDVDVYSVYIPKSRIVLLIPGHLVNNKNISEDFQTILDDRDANILPIDE